MWYAILIMLVVDLGGLLLIYVLLRDRVRRVTSVDSQIADVREEVSRLLVELNQTTDRNVALLEDRIARLNESLAVADKKIGLLRREIEKHDVGAQVYSRLAEGRPRSVSTDAQTRQQMLQPRLQMPPAEAAGMPQPRQQMPPGAAGEREGVAAGMPPGVAAERGADASAAAVESGRTPRQPLAVELSEKSEPRQERRRDELRVESRDTEEAPDLHQRVMSLQRAGFSSALIASRVGVPRGEVELIISLEQRKGQA